MTWMDKKGINDKFIDDNFGGFHVKSEIKINLAKYDIQVHTRQFHRKNRSSFKHCNVYLSILKCLSRNQKMFKQLIIIVFLKFKSALQI